MENHNKNNLKYLELECSCKVDGNELFSWNYLEFLSQKIYESIRDLKEESILFKEKIEEIYNKKNKSNINNLEYYSGLCSTLYFLFVEINDLLLMRFCNVMRSYMTTIKQITNSVNGYNISEDLNEFKVYIHNSKFLSKFIWNRKSYKAISYILHNRNYFEFLKNKSHLSKISIKDISTNKEIVNYNYLDQEISKMIKFIDSINLYLVKEELLDVLKIFEKIFKNNDKYEKNINPTSDFRFSNILKYLKK